MILISPQLQTLKARDRMLENCALVPVYTDHHFLTLTRWKVSFSTRLLRSIVGCAVLRQQLPPIELSKCCYYLSIQHCRLFSSLGERTCYCGFCRLSQVISRNAGNCCAIHIHSTRSALLFMLHTTIKIRLIRNAGGLRCPGNLSVHHQVR